MLAASRARNRYAAYERRARMSLLAARGGASPLLDAAERGFFSGLNAFVEPLVRAGWFAPQPPLWSTGLIVLEHTGRRSGRAYATPLLALHLGQALLVSTVRGQRSNWARNLAAAGRAFIWVGGRRLAARAAVLSPTTTLPEELPPIVRQLIPFVMPAVIAGLTVAVLVPETAAATPNSQTASP
jgi:deazaflavin-dependent oxidoreductase (nitroreductase family)